MEANIRLPATDTPLALAAEIRGATSVTVIERGTSTPLWCVAVERSRAVGARTSDVLAVAVVPREVRGAVSHITAAVRAADAIAGAGGASEGWTELVLADAQRLFLVRALTAPTADGLIVCLTLDRRDASLAAARREFERLVAAELRGSPDGASTAQMSIETSPGPSTRPEAAGALDVGSSGLPRRIRRGGPPASPDVDVSWTTEADLGRIMAKLRQLPEPPDQHTLRDP